MTIRRSLLIAGLAVFLLAEPALAAPEPKLGKTAQASTVSGTVKVKEKGESKFGKLGKSPKLIPMGSVVDAERGKVRIRTAGKGKGLSEGTFSKGDFEIRQDKREAVPELVLQGEIGGGGCAGRSGASRGAGDVPRIFGESE